MTNQNHSDALNVQSGMTLAPCELEQLKKDAERYRWLRDPNNDVAEVIDKKTGENPHGLYGEFNGYAYEYRSSEELDAAIDDAMANSLGTAVESAPSATAAEGVADEPNDGMHDSIFIKIWGDAGGGTEGRIALANYAYSLGKSKALREFARDIAALLQTKEQN
jgi:hypothetical protein